MLFFSRYVYDGLEGLGPDMEKLHARIYQSQLKMMKKEQNMFFGDTDYIDRTGWQKLAGFRGAQNKPSELS